MTTSMACVMPDTYMYTGICLLFFFHYRAFLKVEYKHTIAHAECDNKAKVQKIFTAYLNKIILLLKKITGAS